MTRKQAAKHERILKGRGVYKPYVSASDGRLYVESYPLTAIITDGGCDPEMGPAQNVKITDSSLSRIGQDSTITTTRVFLGQDLLAVVGQLLLDFHGPAYERAAQQDRDAMHIYRAVEMAERYGTCTSETPAA